MLQFKLSETDTQKTIIQWLDTLREGYFWENYTTGIPCHNPRTKKNYRRPLPLRSRFASDILGLYKGQFCALEVKTFTEYKFLMKHYERLKIGQLKTKRDHHLAGQITFIETVKLKGGIAGFVYDIESTEKILFQN